MPDRSARVERIDVAVIGAGVTGLAAARAIALGGRSVCVLERHARAGQDTSTHNSGVIHAGLYYPARTLKATLCVRGARLLYEFAAAHAVPHDQCGKLVVAHAAHEQSELERIRACGEANGVEGLTIVDRPFIAAREPHVDAAAGLYSPTSGIVDADAYVRGLLRTAEAAGVVFLPASPLIGADLQAGGVALRTPRETIVAEQVVNAAGLYADDVSTSLGGERFTIHPCRGEYAELIPNRRYLVNALVYPLPDASGHGLGVHLVRTPAGAVWLGPTIRYQARKGDYEDGRLTVDDFAGPARLLLRDVTTGDLRLAGSGIRAKLHPPTESFADFLIRRDTANPRVIQAAGIDSPGLTSSLAIGELVAEIAVEHA
jgi:L-2-hydroxyglutarate oxidase LhgO